MWNTIPVYLELRGDANPVCSQPYTVPRVHEAMLRKELQRPVILGVIKHLYYSKWGSPYFSQPKVKANWVFFLSDYHNLNGQLKHNPCPMPKIRQMLLKLEGFKYSLSLVLNMDSYLIRLIEESINICNIILTLLKYRYKHLTMGVSNSLDIFQDKMNKMLFWFEFIISYINYLLIITKVIG